YKNTLDDLVEWGFVEMVQESKNQYTANVVGLVKNTKAKWESALVKNTNSCPKHVPKHVQSTVGINKGFKGFKGFKDLNNSATNVAGTEKVSRDPGLGSESEKRKKSSAQKKKKARDPGVGTAHWQSLVKVWFDFNNEKLEFEPSFKGQDPQSLKAI